MKVEIEVRGSFFNRLGDLLQGVLKSNGIACCVQRREVDRVAADRSFVVFIFFLFIRSGRGVFFIGPLIQMDGKGVSFDKNVSHFFR